MPRRLMPSAQVTACVVSLCGAAELLLPCSPRESGSRLPGGHQSRKSGGVCFPQPRLGSARRWSWWDDRSCAGGAGGSCGARVTLKSCLARRWTHSSKSRPLPAPPGPMPGDCILSCADTPCRASEPPCWRPLAGAHCRSSWSRRSGTVRQEAPLGMEQTAILHPCLGVCSYSRSAVRIGTRWDTRAALAHSSFSAPKNSQQGSQATCS